MGARILFVTGKGGTGKSSVAAALAAGLEAQGQSALLVRMAPPEHHAGAGGQGPAGAGDTPPRNTAEASGAFAEMVLDEGRDLEAFLTRVIGLGFVARRLQDSRTFSAVAAAAPGLRDLVALAAIVGAARRRRGHVIVDAPATGHSVPMLTAPARVLDLAPFGPVAREARAVLDVLHDRRAFAAVLVTTPEEMAITEVRSLHEQVVAAGVAASCVVVNALWPVYVSEADGESFAASHASPDAAMHWRRSVRQQALVSELEGRLGACSRIPFSFTEGGATLARADVAALLARLAGSACRERSDA